MIAIFYSKFIWTDNQFSKEFSEKSDDCGNYRPQIISNIPAMIDQIVIDIGQNLALRATLALGVHVTTVRSSLERFQV